MEQCCDFTSSELRVPSLSEHASCPCKHSILSFLRQLQFKCDVSCAHAGSQFALQSPSRTFASIPQFAPELRRHCVHDAQFVSAVQWRAVKPSASAAFGSAPFSSSSFKMAHSFLDAARINAGGKGLEGAEEASAVGMPLGSAPCDNNSSNISFCCVTAAIWIGVPISEAVFG